MINETQIQNILDKQQDNNNDQAAIHDILQKALELNGLNLEETATLAATTNLESLEEIFATARKAKEEIYGNRLVIFAPLYISNFCSNDCAYCAFCAKNKALKRRALSQQEIARETETLINQGHKRILLLSGEDERKGALQYALDSIATIYSTQNNKGNIRRINANIAPLSLEDFKLLKRANIGTYQLFQETYHRKTYKEMHLRGPKSDYDWRITAMDRAMAAGIDDVGLGVLFGLTDWHFEILALLQHVDHLNNKFGIGPHTISVPRLEPALGSTIASNPPAPVSDIDFCKIIAILRLAVPYTGIIMSTRETPELRSKTFALGISQISAGSRTDPGSYSEGDEQPESGQFSLGDHRSLDEVISDIISLGYTPSFCTACYRLGRTGEDFMCLAKPGLIKNMCIPNSLLTMQEYLTNFAPASTRALGENLMQQELAKIPEKMRAKIEASLREIEAGKKDLFV